MEMSDKEFRLYQARERAAAGYRHNGFIVFADEVERGEHDECHLMRLAKFQLEPPQPLSDEYVAAWNKEMARIDGRQTASI